MIEPFAFKTSAVKVPSIVPVEIGAIVFIVHAVTEVAIPNGVVVISIPGELILIDDGRGGLATGVLAISVLIISILIISVLVYGGRSGILLISYSRGRRNIHSAYGKVESDVDGYLGISRSGEQGAGEDRGEYK